MPTYAEAKANYDSGSAQLRSESLNVDGPGGGVNSFNTIPPEQQAGTTVVQTTACYYDDVIEYMKADQTELLRIRNQAYNAAVPNDQTPLIGRTDSDPAGG